MGDVNQYFLSGCRLLPATTALPCVTCMSFWGQMGPGLPGGPLFQFVTLYGIGNYTTIASTNSHVYAQ